MKLTDTPPHSAQGDAAEDAGQADDEPSLLRRALHGLARLGALGEQTAAYTKELKQVVGDISELKVMVESISETVGAMAQRDALLLASGTLPQLRIKGAVVNTLWASCARSWA